MNTTNMWQECKCYKWVKCIVYKGYYDWVYSTLFRKGRMEVCELENAKKITSRICFSKCSVHYLKRYISGI